MTSLRQFDTIVDPSVVFSLTGVERTSQKQSKAFTSLSDSPILESDDSGKVPHPPKGFPSANASLPPVKRRHRCALQAGRLGSPRNSAQTTNASSKSVERPSGFARGTTDSEFSQKESTARESSGFSPPDSSSTQPHDAIHDMFGTATKELIALAPKRASKEGFSKLFQSIQQVMRRMEPGTTLEERWDRLSDFMNGYYNDPDSKAGAKACKKVLKRVFTGTVGLPQHCEPRVAACTMALDQILYFFTRYQPAMANVCTVVRDTLHSAIFVQPPEDSAVEPFHEAAEEATDAKMSRYIAAGTWVDEAKRAQDKLRSMEEHGEKASQLVTGMQEMANYWKEAYLRKVFTGWRAVTFQQTTLHREKIRMERELKEKAQEDLERSLKEHKAQILALQAQVSELTAKISGMAEDVLHAQGKENSRALEVHQQTMRVAELERSLRTTKADCDIAVVERDQLRRNYRQLGYLMKRLLVRIKGDNSDRELQEALQEVVRGGTTLEPGQTDDLRQRLLNFCNKMLARTPECRWPVLTDFLGGPRMLDCYFGILVGCASQYVTRDDLKRNIGLVAPVEKANALLSLLGQMGVETRVTAFELMQIETEEPHLIILTSLVNWCFDAGYLDLLGPPGSQSVLESARMVAMEQEATSALTRKASVASVGALEEELLRMTPEMWLAEWKDAYEGSREVRKLGKEMRFQTVEYCFDMNKQRNTVKEFVKEEQRKFSKTKAKRLEDILPRDPELQATASTAIEAVLEENVDLLRRVYKYYASSDNSPLDRIMSGQEFWRFCTDAKITDKKKFTRDTVRAIFHLVNRQQAETYDDDPTDTEKTMSPGEWVESLLRIAHTKFIDVDLSLADKLRELLARYVQPNCSQLKVDEFREQVNRETVQNALRRNQQYLLDIFRTYTAVRDQQTGQGLSFTEFKKLMHDAQLFDEVFTIYAAQHIFVKIQDDDDPSLEMFFHEFQEALVAVCIYKNPAPYLPLHQRLQHFFAVQLLPPIAHKFPKWRLQGPLRAT